MLTVERANVPEHTRISPLEGVEGVGFLAQRIAHLGDLCGVRGDVAQVAF